MTKDWQARKNLNGLRVLVIDDHPDAADLLAMVMKEHGASTKVAYEADGLGALVSEFDPTMVVLDLGMPRVTGFEACQRLRDLKGDTVCAVSVTGCADAEYEAMAKRAGFDCHFVKPVNFEALLSIAESALSRAK